MIYFIFGKTELKRSNSEFVNTLLKSSSYYLSSDKTNNNYLSKFINLINNIQLNKPAAKRFTIIRNLLAILS